MGRVTCASLLDGVGATPSIEATAVPIGTAVPRLESSFPTAVIGTGGLMARRALADVASNAPTATVVPAVLVLLASAAVGSIGPTLAIVAATSVAPITTASVLAVTTATAMGVSEVKRTRPPSTRPIAVLMGVTTAATWPTKVIALMPVEAAPLVSGVRRPLPARRLIAT